MSKFTDGIRAIARTIFIESKIKLLPSFLDRQGWGGGRGITSADVADICPIHYTTDPNSYDIAALLAGTVGPKLSNHCAKLDTITGLTDFDTSTAVDTLGATVHLVIQLDGVFD